MSSTAASSSSGSTVRNPTPASKTTQGRAASAWMTAAPVRPTRIGRTPMACIRPAFPSAPSQAVACKGSGTNAAMPSDQRAGAAGPRRRSGTGAGPGGSRPAGPGPAVSSTRIRVSTASRSGPRQPAELARSSCGGRGRVERARRSPVPARGSRSADLRRPSRSSPIDVSARSSPAAPGWLRSPSRPAASPRSTSERSQDQPAWQAARTSRRSRPQPRRPHQGRGLVVRLGHPLDDVFRVGRVLQLDRDRRVVDPQPLDRLEVRRKVDHAAARRQIAVDLAVAIGNMNMGHAAAQGLDRRRAADAPAPGARCRGWPSPRGGPRRPGTAPCSARR